MSLVATKTGLFTVPRGWTWVTFGEICNWSKYGLTITSEPGGKYPLLRMNNLQDGRVETSDLVYVNLADAVFAEHKLGANELLVNRTNSLDLVGKTALFQEQGDFVSASYLVRFGLDKRQVYPSFVNYFFNSPFGQQQLRILATRGVSQANINPSVLRARFQLPLPPLAEQRKIAAILSAWDEAIAAAEHLIAALKQRKRGLMQRLLTGQVRFPGFGDAWKRTPIGNFLIYTPRKIDKPSVAYTRMGIRSHGKGTFTEVVKDPSSNAMDELYQVKGGDLIVNITFAWEQAIAIVDPKDDGALVSHRFPTYEFNTKRVNPNFFRYVMLTKRFLYELDLITPGGAGRNRVMSKPDFLKIQVELPSLREQDRIADVLTGCDAEIATQEQHLALLRQQKRGLMQRLLTGQVRVPVDAEVQAPA